MTLSFLSLRYFNMAISYSQAVTVFQDEARRHSFDMKLRTEQVPL